MPQRSTENAQKAGPGGPAGRTRGMALAEVLAGYGAAPSFPFPLPKITRGGEHNNNCFVADPTGSASYNVAPNPPAFSWWHVISQ